jgi:hypothetical protein
MILSQRTASSAQGFAAAPGNALYPWLWSGLIGLWCAPVAWTGTTVLDYSPVRSHGTLAGAAPPVSGYPPYAGGLSVDFPGATGYVQQVASATLWNASGAGTWTFWIRVRTLPALSSPDAILSSLTSGWLSGQEVYVYNVSSVGTILYDQSGTGAGAVADSSGSSGPLIVVRNWYHIAFTWSQASGGTNSLYVNGVLFTNANTTNSGAWAFGSTAPRIGGPTTDFGYLDGQLHSVCLYNRKLSPVEIAGMAQGESPLELRRPRRVFSVPAAAPAGRTTHNTRSRPLGTALGIGRSMTVIR